MLLTETGNVSVAWRNQGVGLNHFICKSNTVIVEYVFERTFWIQFNKGILRCIHI